MRTVGVCVLVVLLGVSYDVLALRPVVAVAGAFVLALAACSWSAYSCGHAAGIEAAAGAVAQLDKLADQLERRADRRTLTASR